MNDDRHHEFDELLRATLNDYADEHPRLGLDERILANLPERTRVRWWLWTPLAIAGASAIVAAALSLHARAPQPHSMPIAASRPAAVAPPSVQPSAMPADSAPNHPQSQPSISAAAPAAPSVASSQPQPAPAPQAVVPPAAPVTMTTAAADLHPTAAPANDLSPEAPIALHPAEPRPISIPVPANAQVAQTTPDPPNPQAAGPRPQSPLDPVNSGTQKPLTAASNPLAPAPAQTASQTTAPVGTSRVRIVRLSEVKGAVQLDRNTGHGYEPAMENLPIVEHSRLQTGVGIAEVELEDNSTIRVIPESAVEFAELGRLPGGATSSSVRLIKGTAYVSLLKTRGTEFTLLFGQQKLMLPPGSHIRLQVSGAQATLAVFDGTLNIDGPAGPVDVSKKNTMTFQLSDQTQPTVAKTEVKDPVLEAFDSWDKDAAALHSSLSAFGSPYAYGVSDLQYYGSFSSFGGCGSMWRPYFASAAWDPFSNGVWAWYPGAGYSWVSPYPWGWTPYHFGSWSFCPGTGWGWQPGGSWNGLNNVAVVPGGGLPVTSGGAAGAASNGGPARFPPRPVRPPGPGEPTLKVFNLKPLVRSEASEDSFVFRKDSAGLGVPREGLGKLNKLSEDTISRGTATAPIPSSTPGAGRTWPDGRSGSESNGHPANETNAQAAHRNSTSTSAPADRGQWNNSGANSSRSGSGSNSQPTRSYSPPPSPPPPPPPSAPAPAAPTPASTPSQSHH